MIYTVAVLDEATGKMLAQASDYVSVDEAVVVGAGGKTAMGKRMFRPADIEYQFAHTVALLRRMKEDRIAGVLQQIAFEWGARGPEFREQLAEARAWAALKIVGTGE